MISFGRPYICNPDLAERIINGLEIDTSRNWATYFRGPKKENLGAKGYTDYPFY